MGRDRLRRAGARDTIFTMPDTSAALSTSPADRLEPLRILIPSPIGSLGVELQGKALTRVVIVPKGREKKTFVPFTDAPRSDYLDEVLGRFSEYFAGARMKLNLPYTLPKQGLDAFAKRVLKETTRIPYGKTRTHQQIAKGAGNAQAYRVVLATLMANPLPIIIPCHRVVPSGSGVGSYIAGSRKKKQLLKLEEQALAKKASN
jgi:methylated-DNA-[protein]-cysteine S-methyltransferase